MQASCSRVKQCWIMILCQLCSAHLSRKSHMTARASCERFSSAASRRTDLFSTRRLQPMIWTQRGAIISWMTFSRSIAARKSAMRTKRRSEKRRRRKRHFWHRPRQSRRSMRCCPGSCANAAWRSSIMRSSCPFARCWRGWRRGAYSSIRWRSSRSAICSRSASKKIRRIFSAMPGRNSTSTLPSSWARCSLKGWGFRPSRRQKAATRRMRRSLKSSRAATRSSRRSWTTGRSRS